MQPETRYARLGEDGIAYQVVGEGPADLVMTTGNYSHVDMVWEDPGIALFLRMLASFSRLIVFDRRGTGASDPLPPGALPPWEAYAQDLTAVLDEVGSDQAALLAQLDASRWRCSLPGPDQNAPGADLGQCGRVAPAAPATRASVAGSPGSSAPSPAPGWSRRSCAPTSRWTRALSCP